MKQIAVDQLAAFVADHHAAPPLLLDVREPWEVAQGALQLPGLENLAVPMNEVPQRLSELDASRPTVCLCHHGMRSAQVARFLEQAGFDAVHNLTGGIDAWSLHVDGGVPRY